MATSFVGMSIRWCLFRFATCICSNMDSYCYLPQYMATCGDGSTKKSNKVNHQHMSCLVCCNMAAC